MAERAPFVPPVPPVPQRELSLPAFLRAIRTNALTMWPEAAYTQDSIERRILGRSSLLLNSPTAIHRVLVDNPANYRRSPASIRILRPITGDGLLLSEGETWRAQRRAIAPALAPRVIPMLVRHIAQVATETVATLRATPDRPVDLLAAMQATALEIAGRSMFSLEMREHGPRLRALIAEYGARWSKPYLLDLLLPPAIPSPRDLLRQRFRRRWMALIEQILRARAALPDADRPRDLFDLLRATRDPETGQGFSAVQLRDQAATLILAGHATTAVTLFWALTLLARAPAEQGRVAEEAGGVDLAPEHAAAALPRLVRTRAVVDEALRLYPPAFTITRVATAADRAGGIGIRPGALVLIAPWVLHRHRDLWHDPAAFIPDRFMPGAPAPARFVYLPFGAGPRACVGAQFALAEATLVLAAIIRAFTVELLPAEIVLPVAVVTTQPDHPPLFRLRRRA